MSELVAADVLQYVRDALLPHTLAAVLLTGSVGRRHALAGSDLDFMAFYRTIDGFASYPYHGDLRGQRVTIEHHDIAEFLRRTSDFSWHLGSLRQLHKARDGVVVLGNAASIDAVTDVAHHAHLSSHLVTVLLNRIRADRSAVASLPAAVSHQVMLGYVELLATLRLLSRPGAPAYSKPKWLLRSLEAGGDRSGSDLIRRMYPDHCELIGSLALLETCAAALESRELDDNGRRLISTAVNDAQDMVRYRPADAWPAMRFAVISAWQLSTGTHPVVQLRRGDEVPEPVLRAMGMNESATRAAWLRPMVDSYVREVGDDVGQRTPEVTSSIGSARLVGHLMRAYCADDIFPWMADSSRGSRAAAPDSPRPTGDD